MNTHQVDFGARLGISGTLECRDKDGNIIKRIEMNGSIPLERLGLSVEQARELIAANEAKRAETTSQYEDQDE